MLLYWHGLKSITNCVMYSYFGTVIHSTYRLEDDYSYSNLNCWLRSVRRVTDGHCKLTHLNILLSFPLVVLHEQCDSY